MFKKLLLCSIFFSACAVTTPQLNTKSVVVQTEDKIIFDSNTKHENVNQTNQPPNRPHKLNKGTNQIKERLLEVDFAKKNKFPNTVLNKTSELTSPFENPKLNNTKVDSIEKNQISLNDKFPEKKKKLTGSVLEELKIVPSNNNYDELPSKFELDRAKVFLPANALTVENGHILTEIHPPFQTAKELSVEKPQQLERLKINPKELENKRAMLQEPQTNPKINNSLVFLGIMGTCVAAGGILLLILKKLD